MKATYRVLFGIFLLFVGIALLCSQFGIAPWFNPFILLSLVFLMMFIVLGVYIASKKQILPGAIFILIGLFLLISVVFKVNIFFVLFPVIIIGIAVLILFPGSFPINVAKVDAHGIFNLVVLFYNAKKKLKSNDFKGARLTCVFGGADFDLSGVKVKGSDAIVDVTCVMGNANVIVPKNIRIKSTGTPVVGNWLNQVSTTKKKTPGIVITGASVMGSVTIKN